MITSSVSLRRKRSEVNSLPRTGMSPSSGSFFTLWSLLLDNSPAMAKLWPLPSSTVVSARLVRSAGTVITWLKPIGTVEAVPADHRPVDPQLLLEIAADLGHPDAQIDLCRLADGEAIDDLPLFADDAGGEPPHVLGGRRVADDTFDDDGVLDAREVDVGVGIERADGGVDPTQVVAEPRLPRWRARSRPRRRRTRWSAPASSPADRRA